MVNLQIRLRTMTAFNALEFVIAYLNACVMGFAFEHNKENNHHYHIYLFGIDVQADSVRKHVSKYMPSKETYQVTTTAGGSKRLPLDPRIAYQYGSNPDSSPTLVWLKGVDNETKERWDFSTAAFYAQQEEARKNRNKVLTEVLVINNEKIKVDRTWERLCNELIESPNKYEGMGLPQIKSCIATSYLRQLKAVPRPSDLHRYAVSLYYIAKHGLHTNESAEISDNALFGEYA